MSPKITPEHLGRAAAIYIRQSTMGQVVENTESQRRQYALVDSARAAGFSSVEVIDDDLGRSGSGTIRRPGFQKLVAAVCAGGIAAVYCIEASRLARNGRDWHHLIDLCALVGALVIDPDGVYDPRLVNDRLLLGLKGTMSEYELSLLRQRGLAARDAKARRGELRFTLPPGYCWNELGQIEIDPDERVSGTIRTIFRKFVELGSVRQVFLWARDAELKLPVVERNLTVCKILWRDPAYHAVVQILHNPIYAGAYAFGRTRNRTKVIDGHARKTSGHRRSISEWAVLLRDNHEGYISWEQFEENQRLMDENAHMKKRAARKSARGGRALLTGKVRCGRCGRMMRVFYGSQAGHVHRYQCRGDDQRVGLGLCIGIGGVRIDRAVAGQILEAVSDHAIDAAVLAADRVAQTEQDARYAVELELEEARYEATLAARRHEAVDPAKRLVARELEARWNTALERVAKLERRIEEMQSKIAQRPGIDREALARLAHDLPTVWNAPTTDARTKQRLVHILVQEVIIDLDDATNEAVLIVHWAGGRHTEIRIARVKTGRYPPDRQFSPVEVLRKLAGEWPDRELAVTMNRMGCKPADGATWTTVRVKEMRERLGLPAFDPTRERAKTITADETATRLGICVASIHRLIDAGILPAHQALPSAPWQIPLDALDTEAVRIGVRDIVNRRPKNFVDLQCGKTLRLPGI